MNNSGLPITTQTNDKRVTSFFDKYFTAKLEFASNEVDAVVAFFEKRGFGKSAAISTGSILLQQAKLDGIKVFVLLDTLKGFDEAKLSAVVAEVLNYNRLNTSVLGFRNITSTNTLEKRNIIDNVPITQLIQLNSFDNEINSFDNNALTFDRG